MRKWIHVGAIVAVTGAFFALTLSEARDAERQAPSLRVVNGLRNAGEVTNMANQVSAAGDLDALTRLNADYITSVQKGDVKRFDEILADDFLCSMADGSLIDRQRFLEVTAQPVTIRNLQAHEVNIRLMGDMAIVHAATSFTSADGRPSTGRYTDVWARRGGRWLAVSAHVTRK